MSRDVIASMSNHHPQRLERGIFLNNVFVGNRESGIGNRKTGVGGRWPGRRGQDMGGAFGSGRGELEGRLRARFILRSKMTTIDDR